MSVGVFWTWGHLRCLWQVLLWGPRFGQRPCAQGTSLNPLLPKPLCHSNLQCCHPTIEQPYASIPSHKMQRHDGRRHCGSCSSCASSERAEARCHLGSCAAAHHGVMAQHSCATPLGLTTGNLLQHAAPAVSRVPQGGQGAAIEVLLFVG